MKLLVLLSIFTLSFSAYSTDYVSSTHNYFCEKLGINLPKFPKTFIKWTRTQRKGCLVEDPDLEKHEDIRHLFTAKDKSETPEQRQQRAVCECLKSKSKVQEKLYEWKTEEKYTKWMDDIVWKRMGDHFKGQLYEQFNRMLQMDVLLQRGDVNENFMMYAPKCRMKSVVEQIDEMRGKKITESDRDGKEVVYDCSDKKLFDLRMRVILGTKDTKDFQKRMEASLSKIVKNELTEEDVKAGRCMTYKGYLASRAPSSLRFEILDQIKMAQQKNQGDRKELTKALRKIFEDYNGKYASDDKASSTNPLFNDDYLESILGEDALYGSTNEGIGKKLKSQVNGARFRNKRKTNELQGDPFLQSLLSDPKFFMSFARTKNPQMGFHDKDNLKKVFEDQNKKCDSLSSPALMARMFCNPKLPPVDINSIKNDLAPEVTQSMDNNKNPFGAKVNEYMAAKYVCQPEKKRVDGKKRRWTPVERDPEDFILEDTLNPKGRLLSDLEILGIKNTNDPRYKDHRTEFERINQQMCPYIDEKCRGTNMKGEGCNHIRHVIATSPARRYTLEAFKKVQYGKDILELTDDEAKELKSQLDEIISKYKRPFSVLGLREELKNKLAEIYIGIIEKKTGKQLEKPIHLYHQALVSSGLVSKIHDHVKTLVDAHTYGYGRNVTMEARRDTAFLEFYGEGLKEYFSKLPKEEGGTRISSNADVTPEMILQYAKSLGKTKDEMLKPHYEKSLETKTSRLYRALMGGSHDKIVADESSQGAVGTNYFTDYVLAASKTEEQSVEAYRRGLGGPDGESSKTSMTWAPPPPCMGKTCVDSDGNIIDQTGMTSSPGDAGGVPYERSINRNEADPPKPDVIANTDGGIDINSTNGVNASNGSNGTPTVFNPGNQTRIVGQPTTVVTTRRTSFSDPDATVVNIGGQRRVMVPTGNLEAGADGDTGDDTSLSSPIARKEAKASDTPTRDENMDRIEQNLRDYETLDKIAEIRRQLKQEQDLTRKTLHDIKTDRELAKFNTGSNSSIRQGNILPSNLGVSDGDNSGGANYTPTYGVSTNSSKKSDFDHVMKNGELPGPSGASTGGRGPTSATGGATGLGVLGIGGGISGSALGGIAEKLNMKDPSVLKAIKNASIQLQVENVFPYQLVQEMGIAEVVGTFGLEGQTFYALEIKDFNFTLHKIDLSQRVVEEGGLSGKRKELLASLTLLRGTVGAEATFKQIQNSYVVESSKTLSTNEDKKKLFLKTMTYEELDQLLVMAVHKELKIKK